LNDISHPCREVTSLIAASTIFLQNVESVKKADVGKVFFYLLALEVCLFNLLLEEPEARVTDVVFCKINNVYGLKCVSEILLSNFQS